MDLQQSAAFIIAVNRTAHKQQVESQARKYGKALDPELVFGFSAWRDVINTEVVIEIMRQ